ncbi:MAG: hypothetical protein J5I98_25460 [Phaeodactylibacter sp.]|nr:hypothetical protein [Phaeodactylibacter sp.]
MIEATNGKPENESLEGQPSDGLDIALEEDSPEKILSEIILYENTRFEEKHYKRMGFFSAIGAVDKPQESFRDLLSEQHLLQEQRVSKLKELHFTTDLRLSEKIRTTQQSLDDLKLKWLDHIGEIASFKEKKEEAEKRLLELQKLLHDLHQEIGNKKEKLIDERIQAVRRELEGVIENYQKVYEQRFEINQRTYEDNKQALSLKIKRFENLRDQFQARQAQIAEKINALSLAGINPYVSNFFVAAGFAAAVVAGYFFSIFALSKNLNDENIPFFLIQGLYSFLTQVFQEQAIGIQFLYLAGSFTALIFVLTFISWVCHVFLNSLDWIANNKGKKKEGLFTSNRLVIEAGDSENFAFEAFAESNSFFQFWLQIIPILLITGIILILLFLGIEDDNISNLDTSLTGTVVGSILTFLMTGIVYLYLIRVVEPRIARHPERPFLRNNLELVIISGVFLISTLTLLFIKTEEQVHDPLVIIEFVSIILTAAFLLGYALRFKGLIATANFLDRRINALYDAIRDNSRPRPLNLTAAEDRQFKKEYMKLQKQLLELIRQKNDMIGFLMRGDDRGLFRWKFKVRPGSRLPQKWWKFWRASRTINEWEGPALELTEMEKQLLPKETIMIKEVRSEMAELRSQMVKYEEAILARKEERTSYCTELKEEKAKLLNRIDNYNRHRERIKKVLFDRIDAEINLLEKINNNLKEGFDLGMWYRVNKLGPSNEYYPHP